MSNKNNRSHQNNNKISVFYHELINYIRETYNFKLYASILALLFGLIALNYSFDLYQYFYSHKNQWILSVLKFTLSFSTYLICCGFVYLFTDQKSFFRQMGFWLKSIFIFIIITIFQDPHITDLARMAGHNYNEFRYYYRVFGAIEKLLVVFIPLAFLYYLVDKKTIGHFYGLRTKGISFTPYALMLAMMALPIFLISLTPDFQAYYPEAKHARYQAFPENGLMNPTTALLIFEVFYLLTFIIVEVLYRGLLIFSMSKYLGAYVVLPMAGVYAVLHFGKPINETISSIFGGYILGVLALKTRNIYGGIALHMGIALLMEIFAIIAMNR